MESANKSEIKKQVEYYLSDLNLKQDDFFHKLITSNDTQSIPIDSLLNCNKIKKLNATKEQILEAVSDSAEVEINGDGNGIKRKGDRPLPAFEPKPSKKVKGENGTARAQPVELTQEVDKPFEPKIYKFTLSNVTELVRWDKVQSEIQNATGVKVGYTRIHEKEGHVAVDDNKLNEELRNKLVNTPIKVGDVEVKVEECVGKDLTDFYHNHGGHLDMCLEKSGLKKRGRRDRKDNKKDKKGLDNRPEQKRDEVDFIFFNKRYQSLTPLKQVFKNIIQKTDDDEPIKGNDHQLLLELLKYHDNAAEKTKDIKHFTAGQHPLYKQTRCFFVVRNDGTKEDFSSTKCIDNIKAKYGTPE